MAVLTQSINDGFVQITTLLKQVNSTLKSNQGDLTKLNTADKTSLVNALNELKTSIGNQTLINDSQNTTANTWSATKISNEITTAITNLINGADSNAMFRAGTASIAPIFLFNYGGTSTGDATKISNLYFEKI